MNLTVTSSGLDLTDLSAHRSSFLWHSTRSINFLGPGTWGYSSHSELTGNGCQQRKEQQTFYEAWAREHHVESDSRISFTNGKCGKVREQRVNRDLSLHINHISSNDQRWQSPAWGRSNHVKACKMNHIIVVNVHVPPTFVLQICNSFIIFRSQWEAPTGTFGSRVHRPLNGNSC